MRLPPIQAEWLELPDDELGIRLLAWWIGAEAERKGIDPSAIPDAIAKQIIEATKGMDTDKAQYAALEKALIKAAAGDLAKAGALFRGYMHIGADAMATTDMLSSLSEDTKRGIKVRRGARIGHESIHGTPEEKETNRRKYLDLLDETKQSNPKLTGQSLHKAAAKKSSQALGKKVSYKTFERAEKKESGK